MPPPDPLAYYHAHYPGWTRGQLVRNANTLYQRLLRRGLLGQVPLKPPPFGGDPLAYYQEEYAGMTRGELSKQDPKLSYALRRAGLLDAVPLKRPTRPT